jgi:nucleoside-diphosphate-sugar epimerase
MMVFTSGMRLLVLGGTAWLGGQIARAGLAAGHRVTCLARGEAGSVPPGALFVRADRDRSDAYEEIAGKNWDVVVDLSRQPGHVRAAVSALSGGDGSFVFVSSTSVYADHGTPGEDESAALLPPLESDVMETMETYGEAKVACERYTLDAFGPDRSLIVRAGLIGGPGDISDRTGYWPWRFARAAERDCSVLVPDAPELGTQVIDVRDLAAWIVESASGGLQGIFNATGETVPLPGHLKAAREVAGHSGPVIAAGQQWLLAQGVAPWMGDRSLPLWLPMPEYAGFSTRDSTAARAAGLVGRSLKQALTDTLAWEMARNPARPRRAGLSDDDEMALLQALADG